MELWEFVLLQQKPLLLRRLHCFMLSRSKLGSDPDCVTEADLMFHAGGLFHADAALPLGVAGLMFVS